MHHPPKLPIKKGGPISKSHSRWPMMFIGAGKLIKAACIVFAACVAGYLLKPDEHQALLDIVHDWSLAPAQHKLLWVLQKLASMNEHDLRLIRILLIAYAVLFVLEGVGLILDFAWAEWLLVVTTGLLIPVELWELISGHSWKPAVLFVLNVIVLVYVCYRLKWRIQDKHNAKNKITAELASQLSEPKAVATLPPAETPKVAT